METVSEEPLLWLLGEGRSGEGWAHWSGLISVDSGHRLPLDIWNQTG